MDRSDRRAVASLLGRFSDEMTLVVDRWMGSDWADNGEILALVALADPQPPSTRLLAECSGMHRRGVTRLMARMRADGYLTTERSPRDGREVLARLTPAGRSRYASMTADLDAYFDDAHGVVCDLVRLLGCPDSSPLLSPVPPPPSGPIGLLAQIVTVGRELGSSIEADTPVSQLSGRARSALVQVAGTERVRPSELSPSLGMTRGGVAYVVDDLSRRGLVIRREAVKGDDRRAVFLEVTEAGRRSLDPLVEAISAFAPRLCAVFLAVRDRTDRVRSGVAVVPAT